MIEGRIQEEPIVLDLEVLAVLPDAALPQRRSCSPSARARTVTAHSLKATGMKNCVGTRLSGRPRLRRRVSGPDSPIENGLSSSPQ